MKPLSAYALEQIDAHDYEVFRRHGNANRNRFYKWLVRDGNDIQVRTVAVKGRRDGSVCIKEVVRGNVDSDKLMVKDVALVNMCGYVVDWSPEKLGRKHYWTYNGRWATNKFTFKARFRMGWIKPINAGLLKTVKRFKWCAYDESCGCVLSYLKLYTQHPRIEMLSKGGLHTLSSMPTFVRQLESNKGLMRFVSKNMDEIRENYYKTDVIRMAYKRGITLEQAARIKQANIYFNTYTGPLPAGVEALKALDYITGKRVDKHAYALYLNRCEKLQMNLADTKVTFPEHFKKREKAIQVMTEEAERRARAEEIKKIEAGIAAVSKDFSKLEGLRGRFKIVLPRSEKDFVKEGKILGHCVGDWKYGYASGHADRKHLIVFIRKLDAVSRPFVTVNFDPSAGRVMQCYGRKNSNPEKSVRDFVYGSFTKAAKRIAKAI
jgi:hypothetical protein